MSQEARTVLCRFCGSSISLGAKKCPHCLEFLEDRDRKPSPNPAVAAEFVKGSFSVLSKILLPAAALIALFTFRQELSTKLLGTESIQVGTYGIKFAFPSARGGAIELDPLALMYLLDAARQPVDYKGGLNYRALKPEERAAIELLKTDGLVTATTDEVSDEEAAKRFGIKTTITLRVTEKGREFLRTTKLDKILATAESSAPNSRAPR